MTNKLLVRNVCALLCLAGELAAGSAARVSAQAAPLPCFATQDDLSAYVHQHPPQSREDYQKYRALREAIDARAGANPCATPEAKPKPTPQPTFRTIVVAGKPLLAPDGTPEGPASGNTYGLAFGDNRAHVDNGLLTSRGTYTYGGGAFIWTYQGADPRPHIVFVVVPIESEGHKVNLDAHFLGWNSTGAAFIQVDADEARNLTVALDGKVHSREPAASIQESNTLHLRIVRVQPDATFTILDYETPPPGGLWNGDFTSLEHTSDEQTIDTYNAILAHNKK